MTKTPHYRTRLIGERTALVESLAKVGRADGSAYAKNAPYRELKLLGNLMDGFADLSQSELTPSSLACQACEVNEPDLDTQCWIEDNLSQHWRTEESYLQGFLDGVAEILEGLGEE